MELCLLSIVKHCRFSYLVEIFIESVIRFGALTIGIVPPITHKHFLIEHCSTGTKKAVLSSIKMTIMINLEKKSKT